MTEVEHHGPVEFDCIDCGAHVFSYFYTGQAKRCATCQWIEDINITEDEKENLRKWFSSFGEEDVQDH